MKALLGILCLLFLLMPVHALTHEVTFTVDEKETTVTHVLNLTQNLTLVLPEDASAIRLNGQERNEQEVSISQGELSYVTKSFHDIGRTTYLSGHLAVPVTQVTMILPPGALLTEPEPAPSVSPRPATIISNGQQLQLTWGPYSDFTFFLSYTREKMSWSLIFILAVGVFVVAGILYARRQRSFAKEHLLPAEQQVVDALSKAPQSLLWQKELQIKTGFTKSRVSRTVRALERRGLVKKIPYGNSNKIQLL